MISFLDTQRDASDGMFPNYIAYPSWKGLTETSFYQIQSGPIRFFFLSSHFSRLATARGFLLVEGATLDAHHRAQCLAKLLHLR